MKKVRAWNGFVLALDLKSVNPVKAARLVLEQDMAGSVYFFISRPKAVAMAKQIKSLDTDLMISIDLLNCWQIMEVPEFVIKALDADAVFASEWFFPRHEFSETSQANAQVQVYL
ncbi:uncharacterized protein TOL2_C42090 [Desulfobacula toluolica Tol2]|uniref:Uncharacterized protein n=1 Tax=Desulfobacula toluolica (strain DSM 7467 / Tol2) TaxID=651182 RepID=K0NNX1_DESTT|nr:uncharacterized protein TOL2_C42090 [Desulfobacula toluolica Tol2]